MYTSNAGIAGSSPVTIKFLTFFYHYFLQALKEAMKVAIEYAETKLGAKMVQIGGGVETKAASNDATDAGDFEVVDKPTGTLKDGPILHCRIGTPIANMIMVTASYAKFNVQQSQSGEFQSFTKIHKFCIFF